MEAEFKEVEDGEIEDDDVGDVYLPLERPSMQANQLLPVITKEDSPEASSSVDSDEDQTSKRFRPKHLKKSVKMYSQSLKKQKNYNIWCENATEDALTTNLNNCNVNNMIDRSRDVESYNYLLAAGNKRTHEGDLIGVHRQTKGTSQQQIDDDKKAMRIPRELAPIKETGVDSDEELALDIANKLFEEREDLVLRIIKIVGREVAIKYYEETRKIEKDGGLLIMNGTRRRTPGGVYFFLVKSDVDNIPIEKMQEIFITDKCNKKRFSRNIRKMKKAKLQEEMVKEKKNLEDFPTLLTRAELAIKRLKERQESDDEAEEKDAESGSRDEGDGEVKNPPPSPATDGKENSSDGEEAKDGMDVA